MAEICRTVFSPESSPVGLEVAKKFPWWATSYQEITDNNAILDKFVFRAPQGNRQAFANDKPWPIYIDEIRFWHTIKPGTDYGEWDLPYLMDQTVFKISTDLQREIVSHWMPGTCFNTEPDRIITGYQQSMMWTLPAPYYLPYGNQFSLEVESRTSTFADMTLQFALRGCDPYNESPRAILTRPASLSDGTATPYPGRLILSFDDNRDRPVQSMWVRDVSATMLNIARTGSAKTGLCNPWYHIDAKFNIPEGPQWTNDLTTPLIAFSEQVPACGPYMNLNFNPLVIHRPPKPYILRPGDAMTIETQVRYEPNVLTTADHRIWAHVRGWQMGEGI
jgi:hypothetical protein